MYNEPYLKQKQNEDNLDSPSHFEIDDDNLYKDIISSPVNIRVDSLNIPQESTVVKRPRSDYFKQSISPFQSF